MLDGPFVFLNGESWRMAGADAKLLRKLANERTLDASLLIANNDLSTLASGDLFSYLSDWIAHGWLHAD